MKHVYLLLTLWIATITSTHAQTLVSSNLPIVIINTQGQWIMDEPKTIVDMAIKYNVNGQRNYLTDANYYNAQIGIETRGSSSATFAKQSYGFETLDTAGIEIDTPMLTMPSGSDWILSASHSDKTFLRNVLPHKLYRDMGYYSPRSEHVELILNGYYQGVYILMEKIKRGKNRVDIAKLKQSDTTGVEVTGGYILKSDKPTGGNGFDYFMSQWYTNPGIDHYGYSYDYPSPNDINIPQKQYIKSFVDSAEAVLYGPNFADPVNGYRSFFNEQTFIDYIILNELAKNPDTYVLSTYFYKPKDDDGRRFCMGPVWDFDLGFKNSYYFDANIDTGFIYPGYPRIAIFSRMMQDTSFSNELKCRWKNLRATSFSDSALTSWVDTMALKLQEGQTRNFTLWPVLGQNVYYNSFPYPLTFNAEIDTLKQWLINRSAYLDAQWASPCIVLSALELYAVNSITIFPNPASNTVTVHSAKKLSNVKVYSAQGNLVCEKPLATENFSIDVSHWLNGFYLMEARNIKGELKTVKLNVFH